MTEELKLSNKLRGEAKIDLCLNKRFFLLGSKKKTKLVKSNKLTVIVIFLKKK